MNDFYKLIELYKNNKKKMTVFIGDTINDNIESINSRFKKEPKSKIFDGIFSDEELNTIMNENINVLFSKQMIYIDDTIENIKKKILLENKNELSFDEIYLFSKKIEKYTNSQIYNNLTKNGKITLTKDMFLDFLLNLNDISIDNIPDKNVYTFNDIIELNLEDKMITFPGQ